MRNISVGKTHIYLKTTILGGQMSKHKCFDLFLDIWTQVDYTLCAKGVRPQITNCHTSFRRTKQQ